MQQNETQIKQNNIKIFSDEILSDDIENIFSSLKLDKNLLTIRMEIDEENINKKRKFVDEELIKQKGRPSTLKSISLQLITNIKNGGNVDEIININDMNNDDLDNQILNLAKIKEINKTSNIDVVNDFENSFYYNLMYNDDTLDIDNEIKKLNIKLDILKKIKDNKYGNTAIIDNIISDIIIIKDKRIKKKANRMIIVN